MEHKRHTHVIRDFEDTGFAKMKFFKSKTYFNE